MAVKIKNKKGTRQLKVRQILITIFWIVVVSLGCVSTIFLKNMAY